MIPHNVELYGSFTERGSPGSQEGVFKPMLTCACERSANRPMTRECPRVTPVCYFDKPKAD